MLDLIPWLDETYIVEMGRLFLTGGDACSTLLGRSNIALKPLYYIGPVLQELAFRCCGQSGVRISPFVGLFVSYLGFRSWLRRGACISKTYAELLSLVLLLSPVLFQSALLARIDCWALACSFAALSVLGHCGASKSEASLICGAFMAVLAVYVWPTAVILFLIYPVFAFGFSQRREFMRFCMYVIVSGVFIAIPILGDAAAFARSFARHYGEVASPSKSIFDISVALFREVARSPFIAAMSVVGFVVWIKNRKVSALLSFIVAFIVSAIAGLYTFRIVYLVPFLFLMGVDAIAVLSRIKGKAVVAFLCVAVIYGVLTGPVGTSMIPHPKLPPNLKETLASEIGTGPIRVFAPDHATYYIGRELGWRQIGVALPAELNDQEFLARILSGCDAAVLREFDKYTPFQLSCTPYGIFCQFVLAQACKEKDIPYAKKSFAARFGSRFDFAWHAPLRLDGFEEVRREGVIRIFKRIDRPMESETQ